MKKCYSLFLLITLAFNLSSFAQYSWNNVGSGTNSPVRALAADTANHIVYAGGIFTQAGGIPAADIAKWNGVSWSPVAGGILSGTGVSALIMKGTDLIAGGNFTNIGGILTKNIAKWDGLVWQPLGTGLDYTGATTVSTLVIYNNELYAGGIFDNSGGSPVNNIAKWNGTNWLPLTTGTNGSVSSLCVYGTDLYVGGTFTDAGGVPVKNIAKWDGNNWSDVGGGVFYTGATTVSTLHVYSGNLYAGGTFTTAGTSSVKNIAKWNGSTWSDVGSGASSYTGATTVSTMTVFNNELVVGGTLDSLGILPVNNIGKWDGTTWTTLGSGTNNSVLALEVLADTLYAGGLFPVAGGNSTPFIAEWIPSIATEIATTNSDSGNDQFIIYPNPVQDRLFFHSNSGAFAKDGKIYTFTLYNLLGTEVMKAKNINTELSFSRENIPAGLYLYKITSSDNKLVRQGKLSFK